MVVKTGNILSGGEILVEMKNVSRISYEESTVFADLTGGAIEQNPVPKPVPDERTVEFAERIHPL